MKIRGFRVEPAEIESTLRKHVEVLDSCVVEQGESGSAHLLAYVVLQSGDSGNADWLREHLAEYLPDFMILTNCVALPLPVKPQRQSRYPHVASTGYAYRRQCR